MKVQRFLISRTDSIGDVLLTLPMCHWIKKNHPQAELYFLGKNYTVPILKAYQAIDKVLDWSTIEQMDPKDQVHYFQKLEIDTIIHVFPNKEIARLAKKAKIQRRIGTSHRLFHLLTCNYRLDFTRKRSDLHEAQLNFELLHPLGLSNIPTLEQIQASTANFQPEVVALPDDLTVFQNAHPSYFVLHPKSQGSALEWPIEKYIDLASQLVSEGYGVAFTGTEKEGLLFREKIPTHPAIIDTTGKMSLEQLMTFIQSSKGLVACSTGPLHIASFLDKRAIGLYSSRKPIHPGRWQPIGKNSLAMVFNENCSSCAAKQPCKCIEEIPATSVFKALMA